MHTVVRLGIDAVAVGIFAALGRASHSEGLTLGDVAATAAPFWLGTAAGWATCWLGRPRTLLGEGVTVTISTLVIGHLLRALFGQGTQLAFILVSLAFVTLFLVGWRALVLGVRRMRGQRQDG